MSTTQFYKTGNSGRATGLDLQPRPAPAGKQSWRPQDTPTCDSAVTAAALRLLRVSAESSSLPTLTLPAPACLRVPPAGPGEPLTSEPQAQAEPGLSPSSEPQPEAEWDFTLHPPLQRHPQPTPSPLPLSLPPSLLES
eukprot:447434-Rhodomonas_salina.2